MTRITIRKGIVSRRKNERSMKEKHIEKFFDLKIKRLNKSEMETLAQNVLTMSTTTEVQAAIEAAIN